MKINISKINTSQKGFSLVELMTVVAIIIIMTTVTLIISSKSGAIQDVDAVAQQIASQVRTLQNESLAGKRVDVGGYKNVCRFVFTTTATSYSTIYQDCLGGLIKNNASVDIQKKRVGLNSTSVTFESPRGKIIGGTPVTIIITSNKDSSAVRYVRIYDGGNVTVSAT